MDITVMKFGGTSVANSDRMMAAAHKIVKESKKGRGVVAVVSAQGKLTDELIAKAKELNDVPENREMDVLLSAGEQFSSALLAMAVAAQGVPSVALSGWQAGFITTGNFTSARIVKLETDNVTKALNEGKAVIVAGFQGISDGNVTTLGRGGSDTSAVALAAALKADLCQIYTDVDGVYTTDPRIAPNARKLSEITYDEMLELATLGAQVLNNRSVEMAKKYNVEIEVLSSLENKPGTIVKEVANVEKTIISGVAKDDDIAVISIIGLKDSPGIAFKFFNALAAAKVNVDIILQSVGRDGTKDITFTVSKAQLDGAIAAANSMKDTMNFSDISYNTELSKLSIVGTGMESHPGIAAKMFEALYSADINIRFISTSEIKISVLIDADKSKSALRAVHDAFFDGLN